MHGNVLIVDDVKFNRSILKGIINIKFPEFEVFEVENAFKSQIILEKNSIDIIILDIKMPDKDGIEYLTEIKCNDKYKDIPVIMCSALSEYSYIKKALEIGAIDYFVKPLTDDDIEISLPLKLRNAINFHQQNLKLKEHIAKIDEDLKIAQRIQKNLVDEYVESSNAKMWGKYIPCNDIGGDMYSFNEIDGKTWFMIADITGHGAGAALVSTVIKFIFNTLIRKYNSPKVVMENLNKEFFNMFGNLGTVLATAFIGKIDGEKLEFVNAGHPYPIFISNMDKDIDFIHYNGFILGIDELIEYEENFKMLNKGDKILLFTDGLYELEGNSGINDMEEVKNYITKNRNILKYPDKFPDKLVQDFLKINKDEYKDDVAIMLIEIY